MSQNVIYYHNLQFIRLIQKLLEMLNNLMMSSIYLIHIKLLEKLSIVNVNHTGFNLFFKHSSLLKELNVSISVIHMLC